LKNLHVRLFFAILLLVAGSIWVVVTKPISKGLDIQGGMRVVLQAKTNDPDFVKKKGVWNQEKLETVANIMRKRVDYLGVAEPLVYPQGNDRIVVELPGIKNKEEALKVVQTTAKLQFRYVKELEGEWKTEPEMKDGKETGYETIIGTDGKPVSEAELNDKVFSQPPILSGDELESNSRAELGPKGYWVHFEFRNGEPKRIF
jgi:SecD/SecF fusion protein